MPYVPVVDADRELDDGRNLAYCSWGLGRECSLLGSRMEADRCGPASRASCQAHPSCDIA
jgi:hypothetical protein